MNIGILDADFLYRGTTMPNLASMKLSAYHKQKGDHVELCRGADVLLYDKIYVSKVFTDTIIPQELYLPKCIRGGTGFFMENAEPLPSEIEHIMPDYDLYKDVEDYKTYRDFSVGFLTRGCFRKCPFCVNKRFDKVLAWSEPSEFVDQKRKYIYLLDDNFLAFWSGWENLLDKLEATGKRFQFRQGLDLRIMTEKQAERLGKTRYYGDFIFAFDNIKDREIIERKLKQWRKFCSKNTKLYVLSAFFGQGIDDIVSIFERIKILFKYKCFPYVMRYKDYVCSKFKDLYIQIARWANQPQFVKKLSFREYCEIEERSHRIFTQFVDQFPILKDYAEMKFNF